MIMMMMNDDFCFFLRINLNGQLFCCSKYQEEKKKDIEGETG